MLKYKMHKITISNSSLEAAQQCPTKYYWKKIRNLSKKSLLNKAPMIFGSAIHLALEEKGKGADLDEALLAFTEEFPSDLGGIYTVAGGELMIKKYYEKYEKDNLKPLLNEQKFTIDYEDFILEGIIDKIVEDQDSGELLVMDHKTTGRMTENFYTMGNPNQQFTAYIHAASCEFDPSIDTLVVDGLLVPYPYKSKEWHTELVRYRTSRSQEDLDYWVKNTSIKIKQIEHYKESGFWPRNEQAYMCSQCDYQILCMSGSDCSKIEAPASMYEQNKPRK